MFTLDTTKPPHPVTSLASARWPVSRRQHHRIPRMRNFILVKHTRGKQTSRRLWWPSDDDAAVQQLLRAVFTDGGATSNAGLPQHSVHPHLANSLKITLILELLVSACWKPGTLINSNVYRECTAKFVKRYYWRKWPTKQDLLSWWMSTDED